MEKKAVVGLFYKDDKYLMVSRKSGKYGFLGGKIEENETSIILYILFMGGLFLKKNKSGNKSGKHCPIHINIELAH